MAYRKPFSRALYNAYDGPARDKLVGYLTGAGHSIVANAEDYGVDVVSSKGDFIYLNEAEVKTGWEGKWPSHWTDIRIPERKQRLLDKYVGHNGVLNFYIFSRDLTQAWRIKDTLLTKECLGEAKGRYIKEGELFFHIPYTKAELIQL